MSEAAAGGWHNALAVSYEQLLGYLVAYVPQVVGALFLLLLGWLIAWGLSRLTTSLLLLLHKFLDGFLTKLIPAKSLDIKPRQIRIMGKSVFWVVMLFFFAAATSSLGMDFIATWLQLLLGYLPRLLAAGIIIISGYFIGSMAGTMAMANAGPSGFRQTYRIGTVIKIVIVSIAIVVGIEQLGINIQFFTTLVLVLLSTLSAGIALAYGLGCAELVKNLVGAKQARKHFRLGECIAIAGIRGELVEISATMLILDTSQGRAVVPAKLCLEAQASIVPDEETQ
ncbi:mechanosensitive ion channel [Shewanella sp. AS16]|uniref:mechanosensitive ion channel family protein n=1 Tax=Shewanella sp. AS16 TaxID=2907625 RepID=UPI001F1F2D2A|nr:mechanosensitive ion channel domain-containing protein [Shewanella sp. AS16]MCE9684897.1 mechanosensitive ion channel [Shewanella sp. AS16]